MGDVAYEVRGAGAWIRIDRPQAMNALSPAVITGLAGSLDRAEADDDVRAVVVTGSGRTFCAGADLKAVRRMSSDDPANGTRAFLRETGQVLRRIEDSPKPVVAAVNGLALAGGLELVLCCDLVVAAHSAKLGDAHANFGLLPGGGSSIRLPRKIGPTWAKYLLFTGDFLDASELVPLGLVNKVVPDDELTAACDELVETLASKSPLGIERMKQLVHDGLEQPVDTGLRLELLASEAHGHSRDMVEGLAAFNEKRVPHFTGH